MRHRDGGVLWVCGCLGRVRLNVRVTEKYLFFVCIRLLKFCVNMNDCCCSLTPYAFYKPSKVFSNDYVT